MPRLQHFKQYSITIPKYIIEEAKLVKGDRLFIVINQNGNIEMKRAV